MTAAARWPARKDPAKSQLDLLWTAMHKPNYVRPVIMHGARMMQRIWAVFSLDFLFPTEPCRA